MKFSSILCALLLGLSAAPAPAASEIVIAIRYLQAEGTSHAHLYLYREDGKFLRQLTREKTGQERDPIFAPDGETIIFTREMDAGDETWSVEPRGGNRRRLNPAPEWYLQTKSSPFFTNVSEPEGTPPAEPPPKDGEPRRYKAPDGSVELVLKEEEFDDADQTDGPGHGKHYLLRDLGTKTEIAFEKLPGFEGVWDILHGSQDRSKHFLFEGPLRLAFFDLHLDSTEGDTVYALDLVKKRLVRLGPNWSAPIPLPQEPAFMAVNYQRYVDIPKSTKTANCSYVERWDADLQKLRYAEPGSAAICYGFSMYRPGRTPPVVTVRKGGE